MKKFKVITDFTTATDAGLDVDASTAVKGLTGNANFTFGGTVLKDFGDDAKDYHTKLGEVATGGKQAVTAKNTSRTVLEQSYSDIAVSVNQQANGDLGKLQSSGIKLAKQPGTLVMDKPINFQVENGVNGDINVSVDVSPVGDYGAVFAYTPVANAASNIDTWILKPVNGHKSVIKGLPAGVPYLFSVAYKGNDDADFVWASPITKYVSN